MKKGSRHSKEVIKKIIKAKRLNPTRYWLGKKRPEMKNWPNLKKWRKGGFKKYQFKKGHESPIEWRKKAIETMRIKRLNGYKNSEKQRKTASDRWIGEKNPRWSNAKYKDKYGYIFIKDKMGRRRKEHRVVAEKIIGRKLKRHETIHHINENKSDNSPKNLYYYPNDNLHKSYHGFKNKPKLTSNIDKA